MGARRLRPCRVRLGRRAPLRARHRPGRRPASRRPHASSCTRRSQRLRRSRQWAWPISRRRTVQGCHSSSTAVISRSELAARRSPTSPIASPDFAPRTATRFSTAPSTRWPGRVRRNSSARSATRTCCSSARRSLTRPESQGCSTPRGRSSTPCSNCSATSSPRSVKAGVRRIVITADHGFVTLSRGLGPDRAIDPPPGGTGELHRRGWVGKGASTTPSTLRVPLASTGIPSDLDLIVPRGLAVFRAGRLQAVLPRRTLPPGARHPGHRRRHRTGASTQGASGRGHDRRRTHHDRRVRSQRRLQRQPLHDRDHCASRGARTDRQWRRCPRRVR